LSKRDRSGVCKAKVGFCYKLQKIIFEQKRDRRSKQLVRRLTGSLDSHIVATAKHGGIVGLFSAALSSAVSSSVRVSWWVASAAGPWAWVTAVAAAVASANAGVPAVVVFQAWVKGIRSESFVENVQHKE
jgi:hypothetical protein